MSAVEEFEVLYDWEPETAEDLGLFAGEFVQIVEKNEHGWWFGTIERGGDLVHGYFPKNYVKEKPRVRDAPRPPPRPVSLAVAVPAAGSGAVEQLSSAVQGVSLKNDSSAATAPRGPSFSLRSLAAFDDLMNKGYAVEITPESNGKAGVTGAAGQQVEMEVMAKAWDGSRSETVHFCNSTVKFVIGKREVVPGLEIAAQLVAENQSANITCSPKMAYGAAGFPPLVPPNSFVIFSVRVISISDAARGGAASTQGPQELLTSGVASSRTTASKAATSNVRKDKLIFVPAAEGHTEEAAAEKA